MFHEYAAKVTKTNNSNQIIILNCSEKSNFSTKITLKREKRFQNDTERNADPDGPFCSA